MRSLRRIDPFALVCALIGIIGFAAGLYHVQRLWPTSDQAIFDYVAFIGNEGGHYYRDAFDISWPAPFLYHALGLALFGVHSWTFQVTDFLILLPIGLVAMWLFLARSGYRRGAWITVATYPIIYATAGPWIAGHRDITGMHLLILAAALPMGNRSLKQRGYAGAVLMLATMIRPTYLFAALPLLLIDMTESSGRVRRGLAWLAGLIAVAAAFLIAGWRVETLGDWYQQAVVFPATRYQVDQERMRLIGQLFWIVDAHWRWPLLTAMTGALLWASDPTRRQCFGSPLAALILTVLVSYFVQNKGFPYHASGLIPLMLLSAAAGIDTGWPHRRRTWTIALLVLTAGGLASGTAMRVFHNLVVRPPISAAEIGRQSIANIIIAESATDARVLQWGRRYDVAVLSQRRSSTRFINSQLLARIPADDPHFGRWIAIFRDELAASPPAFIIIDRDQLPDSFEQSPAAVVATRLTQRDYVKRAATSEVLLLKRR
jgi:hypothetical protein